MNPTTRKGCGDPDHLGFKWDQETGEYVDKTEDDIEWPVYDEAKGG